MEAMNPATAGEERPPEGDEPAPEPPAKKKRGRFGLPRPVYTLGRLLILALLIEYLVVPQLAGPRKILHLIDQVNPLLLLAGMVLEVAALLSYAQLTRSVLPASSRVRYFNILRIQLTTLSVSHVAPGGSAAGTALGYRMLTQNGANATDSGFALGLQGIGSALVLNVLLWIALVVSIPVWGFSPEYLLAALVGAVLLVLAASIVLVLTRGQARVGPLLERAAARVPFVDGEALRRSYSTLADHLHELTRRRDSLIWAVVWAVLNWLFDAASLYVFVGAFGHWVNPDGLLVAYGLANVLAAIPLTPGGLGVVEATLTALLVGFGTPRGIALAGVLVYRLFQFWAPIPLGGLAYLSLQASRHQESRNHRVEVDDESGEKVPMLNFLRRFRRDAGKTAPSSGLTSAPK
jgi:uncharacterized protein (TIRG00374 family)